jgi:hypothetical protein
MSSSLHLLQVSENNLLILSLSLVMVEDHFGVSIAIPETKAGLYFVFPDDRDLPALLRIIEQFHPTAPKEREKLKLSPSDGIPDQREELLIQKRRKLTDEPARGSLVEPIPLNEPFTLSPVQRQILQSCLDGHNLFFTGGAGTGKSTLLKVLVKALIAKHGSQSVYVTATTGLAACAIGGITVHQFGGIKAMSRGSRSHPIQVLPDFGTSMTLNRTLP